MTATSGQKCIDLLPKSDPLGAFSRMLLDTSNWVSTRCYRLGSEGYAARPFVIPACGVDAPHRRDRVWIVAHSNGSADRGDARKGEGADNQEWLQQRDGKGDYVSSFSGGAQHRRYGQRQQ